MANFPLQDVQKVPYTITELDADGNPATPAVGDTCTVVSSDLGMATVVPDATPAAGLLASGFIVGGKTEGTVTITVSVAHQDGSAGPDPVSDLIDIVSGPPATLGFSLGTPVAQ